MRKLTKLQIKHRRWCKIRFWIIIVCYTWDWVAKAWTIAAPSLIYYGVLTAHQALCLTPWFATGFIADYLAKVYHLKSTKLRKRS
jgi:hypothetical protein